MSTAHVVQEGEHLSAIAAAFGFSNFLTIWNHPDNAELKKLRKNPNVLFAGDVVAIPDPEAKQVDVPTGQKNPFVAARAILQLRVKVLDPLDKPRAPPCVLIGDGLRVDMTDEGGGVLGADIPPTAKKAEMFFADLPDESPLTVPIGIGLLDPITEVAGQRQRLNNLGYFAGFDARSTAQFKFAVEEFQCDHLKEVGKKKEDGICDAKTQAALVKAHGV